MKKCPFCGSAIEDNCECCPKCKAAIPHEKQKEPDKPVRVKRNNKE